jgi:hypothetical protein
MTVTLPLVVAEWPKNGRGEVLRVALDRYKKNPVIDCRTWWPDAEGVVRPGKGITVSVKHLSQLASALAEAERRAGELGLLNEGGPE